MSDLQNEIDAQVALINDSESLAPFAKAGAIAKGVKKLKELLTDEFMSDMMPLQGTILGFKTDQDKKGGYGIATVRDCLIVAISYGVQPAGNQFNIIAGNCYITKEGYGYLLNKTGYEWNVSYDPPRMQDKSALINMKMKYRDPASGEWVKLEDQQIPIRVNQYMGDDGVIGKGMRKARKILYEAISGRVIPDGDTEEVEAEVLETKKKTTVSAKSTKAEQVTATLISIDKKKKEEVTDGGKQTTANFD